MQERGQVRYLSPSPPPATRPMLTPADIPRLTRERDDARAALAETEALIKQAEARLFTLKESARALAATAKMREDDMMRAAGLSADDVRRIRDYAPVTLSNGRW